MNKIINWFKSKFGKKSPTLVPITKEATQENVREDSPAPLPNTQLRPTIAHISRSSYLKGRDAQYPLEYTSSVVAALQDLLPRVNCFLSQLDLIEPIVVSSGWRPKEVNEATPNASKHSLHLIGKAIDIQDVYGDLYKKAIARPDLLRYCGLWMEEGTIGWCHFDSGSRKDRPSRTFKA